MKAINPITDAEFEIPADTVVSEIITDEEGNMFEVIEISDDGNVKLEVVTEEEDWGE
ncbi:hypothetical protein GF389_01980 [Candidatus Dojkabacteria bacterium]|nr:hypothetical protein [Candidatus Dojkabacteria bacterium]